MKKRLCAGEHLQELWWSPCVIVYRVLDLLEEYESRKAVRDQNLTRIACIWILASTIILTLSKFLSVVQKWFWGSCTHLWFFVQCGHQITSTFWFPLFLVSYLVCWDWWLSIASWGCKNIPFIPQNFPLKLLITELMFYMKRESELQFQLLGRNFPERRGQIFFRLLFYQMLKWR